MDTTLTIEVITERVFAQMWKRSEEMRQQSVPAMLNRGASYRLGDVVYVTRRDGSQASVELDWIADVKLPINDGDLSLSLEELDVAIAGPAGFALAHQISRTFAAFMREDALVVSANLPLHEDGQSSMVEYEGVYLRGGLTFDIVRKESLLAFDLLYGLTD